MDAVDWNKAPEWANVIGYLGNDMVWSGRGRYEYITGNRKGDIFQDVGSGIKIIKNRPSKGEEVMGLTDLNNWPDGAEAYTDRSFKQWIDAKEFIFSNGEWIEATENWDLAAYKSHGCKVTMRPEEPGKWKEGEERMGNIAQNGNDGHYEELEDNKNKYQREIKEGVFVDVYDVLKAFNVVNPAMAHAIKKMLAPGQRGAKDTIQDMKEAIQSIERSIELEK